MWLAKEERRSDYFFLLANAIDTLPLINRFTRICLRTRSEFLRGSPSLVELEQRYCFLFTSVNPNELSHFLIGKGKTKQKPDPANKRLSNCQSSALKVVWVTGVVKEMVFYNPSLPENLKAISLHYMQILYGIYITHFCQAHRLHVCVWKAYLLVSRLVIFPPGSCLLDNKFQALWFMQSWEDMSGGPS